jgi:hypothetical protein
MVTNASNNYISLLFVEEVYQEMNRRKHLFKIISIGLQSIKIIKFININLDK